MAAVLTGSAMVFAAGAGGTPVLQVLPAAQVAGQARLTWWGLAVYDATLWVTPGFTQRQFERSEFALELAYLRTLRGSDIARRSIEEMRRADGMSSAQAQRWGEQMQTVFPDVAAGDRITGVNRPGRGASFFVNGKAVGEITDPEFARRFFGIWLATTSSEPGMRAALLGSTSP